jgi:hypothetical protein
MTALAATTDSVIYLRRDSIVAPGASCKHLQITTATVSNSFLPMSRQIKPKRSSCNLKSQSTACRVDEKKATHKATLAVTVSDTGTVLLGRVKRRKAALCKCQAPRRRYKQRIKHPVATDYLVATD